MLLEISSIMYMYIHVFISIAVNCLKFSAVYRRSLEASPTIPDPSLHGWKVEKDNLLLELMTLSLAPESVLKLAYCSGTCRRNRCSNATVCTCLQNNVPCTELCKCARENCHNVTGYVDNKDDEEDDDDEIAYFED